MAGRRAFPVVVCLVLLGAGGLGAQLVTYDFNALAGDDVYPFADLDGQDGWTSQGYIFSTPTPNFHMGVTATLGFDGTPDLRFEDGGSGVGVEASHLRDASLPLPVFTGNEELVVLQADVYIGYWWGDFALAHDANGDGEIRVPVDASEVGPGVRFGANEATSGIRVVGADGTFTQVPLATVGDYQDWIRLRLAIDPVAGTGTLLAQNLTAGATDLSPVPGLENVPLGLDPAATGGANPALWDAVFIHFEGLPYQLDNLVVGAVPSPLEIPALSKAGLALLAAALVGAAVALVRRRRT